MIRYCLSLPDSDPAGKIKNGLEKAIRESVDLLKERSLELSKILASKSNPKILQNCKVGLS